VDAESRTVARGGFEVALLFVLIVGIGWLIFRDIADDAKEAWQSGSTPVVVLPGAVRHKF
jgi:hypothetical protein